ncbi:putative NADPH-dependent methylglyoxal reductase GRP2 [Spathaspora sp. JA1]|nr:putative NADPH-dependent methylglyoxal reductase GRP2 [Spathaspora sp. JA1]
MSTVFVSGASGFIASHTVQQLLNQGYTVIGSVRSESKGEALSKALKNDKKFSYVIVSNIADAGAFDSVLKAHPEITGFLHIASPFRMNVTDPEKETLIPAIQGTKNVLESIQKHAPQISRVVITSSDCAARENDDKNPNITLDESVWSKATYESSKSEPVLAYLGSKPLAERLAWDFVKTEKPTFELVTVLPSYTFGPQIDDSLISPYLNQSTQVLESMLYSNPDSKLHHHIGSFIDVRDAARAHLVALTSKEAPNHRLILSSSRFTAQSVYDILSKQYPQLNTFKGEPGSDVAEIATLQKLDYSKTKKILGFEYIPLKKSVVDTVDQILSVRA